MKYIMLLGLLLCSAIGFTQTPAVTVTMAGIGDIKVGMRQSELEKITGQPIKLKKRTGEEYYYDTIRLTHKSVPYEIMLAKETDDKERTYLAVYEIKTNSPQIKTKSGISLGDDKLKIITTYEGYSIHITPTYEGEDYNIKSKTKSTLTLNSDETNNVITFFLENNKVTAISVGIFEGC
jgi:hypothetical protein